MRPRRRSTVLAALVAVFVLIAAPANAATPHDARGFVDTIGVNTHLYYTDTVYSDFPLVKQRLDELGVRHVRDALDPARRQWFYDRVNSLGAAGIKSTLINCRFPDLTGWEHETAAAKTKVRDSLEALEGVNEPNLVQGGKHDDGAWWNDARGCNYWTKELATRDGWNGPPLNVPVLGPSATSKSFQKLGNLWALGTDGGNMHPYPGGQKPSGPAHYPFSRNMREIRDWNFEGRQVPVVATETGYHDAVNCKADDPKCSHSPTSQRAISIYLPRLLMEYAKAGVQRSFLYELVDLRSDPERDDRESNFGLYENDWSYKPSAHAVKNTIALLDSPSASEREPLGYTLSNTGDPDGSGTGGAVKDMLFQQADGTYWLALWQDSSVWDVNTRQDITNPAVKVGVEIDRALEATAYRPTEGTDTYSLSSTSSCAGSSFTADVGDDVLLVKLTE